MHLLLFRRHTINEVRKFSVRYISTVGQTHQIILSALLAPAGRNVGSNTNQPLLLAPAERNVVTDRLIFRSAGAKKSWAEAIYYQHFAPLGLRAFWWVCPISTAN